MAHSSFTGTSVTLREVAVDCPLVADTTILPTHGWFEEKRKKRRKKEIIYFFSFFPFFAKKREGRGKKREQVFLFFSQLLFRSETRKKDNHLSHSTIEQRIVQHKIE